MHMELTIYPLLDPWNKICLMTGMCTLHNMNHMALLSLYSQHDRLWWSGAYLVPGISNHHARVRIFWGRRYVFVSKWLENVPKCLNIIILKLYICHSSSVVSNRKPHLLRSGTAKHSFSIRFLWLHSNPRNCHEMPYPALSILSNSRIQITETTTVAIPLAACFGVRSSEKNLSTICDVSAMNWSSNISIP